MNDYSLLTTPGNDYIIKAAYYTLEEPWVVFCDEEDQEVARFHVSQVSGVIKSGYGI